MTAQLKIKERLIKDEGRVRHMYLDSMGFATIGVGRLIDERKSGGLSDDEIDYLLANDIRRCMAIAGQWDWFDRLDWARQGVIVCMLFQLGARGVSAFRKMIDALARGDYEAAADEMINSRWHRQTPERCERMAQIMRTGEWQ